MCVHSPVLGSISRAVPYLFAAADSRQRVRERVELLRGDAQQLIDLVNTLPPLVNAGPGSAYDSIVLAFSPLDKPSYDQIQQVVALLPTVMFPGGQDRICWLAKLHSDGTSIHLHVLCAQVDLKTGLQFSLHGMGLRPLKELCRYLNLRHGWADPEDAFRGRLAWWSQDLTGPGLPSGTGVHAHARALAIAAVLEDRVASQAEMVRVLQPLGEVVGLGRHSITLDVAGLALNGPRKIASVKFSGLLYARDFDRAGVLRSLAPAPLPAALTRRDTPLEDQRLADVLLARMRLDIKKRAEALAERYAVKRARARYSLVTRIACELVSEAPLDIDLLRQQPTLRSIWKPVSNTVPASISIPISRTSHDATSSADHPIHTRGRRQVSAGAGPVAGGATPAAGLAGLGQVLLESIGAWVRDTLAPRVFQAARRAVGAALDNLLGASNPGGGLGRSGSASGALAVAADRGTDTDAGNISQKRFGAIGDLEMSQDAEEDDGVKEKSPETATKKVRP